MFGGTFSFSAAAASTNFPSASQEDALHGSQDPFALATGGGRGTRDLTSGVVSTTISILKVAHKRHGAFVSGTCDLFKKEWQFVILSCLISHVNEDQEGVWTGEIHDMTGSLPFRYERRDEEFDEGYKADLESVKPRQNDSAPPDENTEPMMPAKEPPQLPARMVGTPQVINDELCFLVSFLRPCDYTEYCASHVLESSWVYLTEDDQGSGVEQIPGAGAGGGDATRKVTKADPYNDDPIYIGDADLADLVGKNRLHRVVWKYLSENTNSVAGASTLVLSLKTFCATKWSQSETMGALEDLEEAGVVMFTDSGKTRVTLVDTEEAEPPSALEASAPEASAPEASAPEASAPEAETVAP